MKEFEKLSFIDSKLYKDGQKILTTWADGSSEVLSSLLGLPLLWDLDDEPVFYNQENSDITFSIHLPEKRTKSVVSQRLHEIFSLKYKSEIEISTYHIKFKFPESQDPILDMEFHQVQDLMLSISPDKKSSLKIHLYPILYEKNERTWLKNFTLTYNHKEKSITFGKKTSVLYAKTVTILKKPFNDKLSYKKLSDEEKEKILKLTENIIPSFSDVMFAFLDSNEIKTLDYATYIYSDMEQVIYSFFIPSESFDLRKMTLNWGISFILWRKF